MVLYNMQQEVYPGLWILEDEKHSRNSNRSFGPIRGRALFGRNQKPYVETSWDKNIRNISKELGKEVQQENNQLYRDTSSRSKGKNTRRRGRVLGEWQENIFLAGKRKQNRLQVQRSRRKKKHGKLPALKPPDKEEVLPVYACQKKERKKESEVCKRQTCALQDNS